VAKHFWVRRVGEFRWEARKDEVGVTDSSAYDADLEFVGFKRAERQAFKLPVRLVVSWCVSHDCTSSF